MYDLESLLRLHPSLVEILCCQRFFAQGFDDPFHQPGGIQNLYADELASGIVLEVHSRCCFNYLFFSPGSGEVEYVHFRIIMRFKVHGAMSVT